MTNRTPRQCKHLQDGSLSGHLATAHLFSGPDASGTHCEGFDEYVHLCPLCSGYVMSILIRLERDGVPRDMVSDQPKVQA